MNRNLEFIFSNVRQQRGSQGFVALTTWEVCCSSVVPSLFA